MATTHPSLPLCPSKLLSVPVYPQHNQRSTVDVVPLSSRLRSSRNKLRTPAVTAGDLLGDFGARDPFPAEIESKFAEKVLGNMDTEHKILIPNISALSLAEAECTPISPLQPPFPKEEAVKLLRKVVGWRLLEEDSGLKLQCLWKVRDYKCGFELLNRIYRVVESVGHFPELHLEGTNQVRAELWTPSIGGLSQNDFIVAAKLDQIKTFDIAPKKRVWA